MKYYVSESFNGDKLLTNYCVPGECILHAISIDSADGAAVEIAGIEK